MQLPVRYGDSSAEEAGLHENCVQYNSGTDTECWGRTAVWQKKYFSQGWEAAACNFDDMEAKGGGKGACATPGAVVDVKPMGGVYFWSSRDSAPKFL